MARNLNRDELLIAEVKKYECLYNTKSPTHRNRTVRENALTNIAETMRLSGFPLSGE